MKADLIVQFVDKKLSDEGTPLARKLLTRLRLRYADRKNNQLVSLAKFYNDPESLTAETIDSDTYRMVSKPTKMKMSKAIHKRLGFQQADLVEAESISPTDDTAVEETQPIPLAKELSSLLAKTSTQARPETDTWTKEIALFMATAGKKRTTAIDELASCVSTIPPTSVEAERTFSASGLFLTKLRCRLSDKSLDMLIFLKFYFANKASK